MAVDSNTSSLSIFWRPCEELTSLGDHRPQYLNSAGAVDFTLFKADKETCPSSDLLRRDRRIRRGSGSPLPYRRCGFEWLEGFLGEVRIHFSDHGGFGDEIFIGGFGEIRLQLDCFVELLHAHQLFEVPTTKIIFSLRRSQQDTVCDAELCREPQSPESSMS